ncbi:MAG: hypothetical protein ACQKBU_05825, partial [Verrucomicrobiales bacterium]
MYDRKTWIVVIICAVLIAVNYYIGSQNAKELAEYKAAHRQEEKGSTPSSVDGEEPGVLESRPPAKEDILEERTVQLETEETVFVLTSIGGGVKTAELLHQQVVDAPEQHVILNSGDLHPVGSLAQGPDGMERVNYAYLEDESIEGEKAVFAARHPSGLIVKKTWSVVPADQPGAAYSLHLQVDVENSKDSKAQIALDQFSLYLGRAAPLQGSEARFSPANLMWREDGDFHSVKSAKDAMLKEGFFSKAQSQIVKTVSDLEYAGVSSQFFTTTLRHQTK